MVDDPVDKLIMQQVRALDAGNFTEAERLEKLMQKILRARKKKVKTDGR